MLYFKIQHGLKNKILAPVKIGALFQNSTWLKKTEIIPSIKLVLYFEAQYNQINETLPSLKMGATS